jgi:hypothetical protein
MCALYLYSTLLDIQVRGVRSSLVQYLIWIVVYAQTEQLHLVKPLIRLQFNKCLKQLLFTLEFYYTFTFFSSDLFFMNTIHVFNFRLKHNQPSNVWITHYCGEWCLERGLQWAAAAASNMPIDFIGQRTLNLFLLKKYPRQKCLEINHC